MRHTLFILGITLLMGTFGIAQPAIYWGSIDKAPGGTTIARVIAGGDWGAITLRLEENRRPQQRTIWLESYDRSLRLERRERVSQKGFAFSEAHYLRGQLYVFGTRRNKEDLELIVQPLGKDLLPAADPLILLTLPAALRLDGRAFDWEFSADSSQLLVYHQLPEVEGLERFALHVFDGDFESAWSKTVTLDYRDEDTKIEDYRVDEFGRVYVQVQRRRRMDNGNDLPEFLLYTFTEDTDKRHVLSPEQPLVIDLTFELSARNEVVVTGFYSEEATFTARGTYYLRFDPVTSTVREQVVRPLDLRFLAQAQLDNPATADRKSPELYRYRIMNSIPRSDGGAVLVAEQRFVRDRSPRPTFFQPWPPPQPSIRYSFNDLLLINLDPDGAIAWTSRLPKRQETGDGPGYYTSFTYASVGDRLYFLFNTDPRNLRGVDLNKYNLNNNRAVLIAAEVRRDGEFTFTPLADRRDTEVAARPAVSRQVDARTLIVCGDSGRRNRIGRIRFK